MAPDVDGAYEDRARGAGFDVASPGAACDALVVHALGDAGRGAVAVLATLRRGAQPRSSSTLAASGNNANISARSARPRPGSPRARR